MDHHKLKILTSHELGFISVREGYDLIHLCFNNLLLNFTFDEFLAFRKMAKGLCIDDCLIPFPDGSRRVILRTPYEGTNFSFLPDEMRLLIDVLDEAYYMQEIYSFIHGN